MIQELILPIFRVSLVFDSGIEFPNILCISGSLVFDLGIEFPNILRISGFFYSGLEFPNIPHIYGFWFRNWVSQYSANIWVLIQQLNFPIFHVSLILIQELSFRIFHESLVFDSGIEFPNIPRISGFWFRNWVYQYSTNLWFLIQELSFPLFRVSLVFDRGIEFPNTAYLCFLIQEFNISQISGFWFRNWFYQYSAYPWFLIQELSFLIFSVSLDLWFLI